MLPPAATSVSDIVQRGARAESRVQVETEKTLRQELEAVRTALRLQTTRCRQVDAALSRKLQQKEAELRSCRSLREEQLSHVMRALMVLEARLRREQRNIRCQLGERDAVIRTQQLEIQRLKKMLDSEVRQEEAGPTTLEEAVLEEFENDGNVKPDLISSLGIAHLRRIQEKSLTPTNTDNEDSQSNLDSLQLSFYEVGSQPESLASNLSTQSCHGDDCDDDLSKDTTDNSTHSPTKSSPNVHWNEVTSTRTFSNNNFIDLKSLMNQEFSSNKKLELKVHVDSHPGQKNVLSPVKEESSVILSANSSPARCLPCQERSAKDTPLTSDSNYQDCKPSPSTLLQEVRISGRNEYEDNPVLNCVNQILLRDQEEFLEEQRALRLKEQEKAKREAEVLNNKKLTKSTENLSLLNEHIIVQHSPVKSKVYPSLSGLSSHNVPEPLIRRTSVEDDMEDTHYKTSGKAHSPITSKLPKENSKSKVIPPALPPKPLRLLQTRPKPLDQKTILNSLLPQDVNAIDVIKNHVPLPQPSSDNDLYVISNSAIDDELLQQLQGRRMKSCSDLTASLNKSKPSSQSRESMYAPLMSHPTHKPPVRSAPVSPQKEKSTDAKVSPKKSPASKDEEPKTTPKHSPVKKMKSPSSCIKVATPVSSLLNSVDVVEPDVGVDGGKKTSPSVSQIVRKFEVLGTDKKPSKEQEVVTADENSDSLQKNFEEFRLDDCDMDALCDDDGRPEGDGAETRLNGSAETRISYENFLEATGLSQKSIMTPSRLFSNHKSVMKPKDVKHRSRVKAAAGVERCNNNNNHPPPGPVVRYWTEPFL